MGNYPAPWSEWNDRYRGCLRDFWRGSAGIGELGTRLSGSADLFHHSGRGPMASINFVTAHDGFTLADLVSYNDKHNEANDESNADGTQDNRSYNHGTEGPTDDPGILALRQRQIRNLMTSLLLSTGVPMLLGGDEFGRTQRGNNNAYCQDNEISWFDWSWHQWQSDLKVFATNVISLRRHHSAFTQQYFFDGIPLHTGFPPTEQISQWSNGKTLNATPCRCFWPASPTAQKSPATGMRTPHFSSCSMRARRRSCSPCPHVHTAAITGV